MDSFLERTKRGLDWLQHGYLLVQIGGSIGVGKAIQAALVTYTHIPPIWVTPLWLLASAVMMTLLIYLGNKIGAPIQGKGSQSQALVGAPTTAAVQVEKYFNRIDPTFSGEVEAAVRQAAVQAPDRETYLIRGLTVALIYVQFESAWFNIFASQIKALQHLNNEQLKREGIFPFYSEAANANAATYATYSFDQWLGFLRSNTLIREDGDLIGITVKGRDFLKFLIDEAKPTGHKTL
jgi:hypothetical protein